MMSSEADMSTYKPRSQGNHVVFAVEDAYLSEYHDATSQALALSPSISFLQDNNHKLYLMKRSLSRSMNLYQLLFAGKKEDDLSCTITSSMNISTIFTADDEESDDSSYPKSIYLIHPTTSRNPDYASPKNIHEITRSTSYVIHVYSITSYELIMNTLRNILAEVIFQSVCTELPTISSITGHEDEKELKSSRDDQQQMIKSLQKAKERIENLVLKDNSYYTRISNLCTMKLMVWEALAMITNDPSSMHQDQIHSLLESTSKEEVRCSFPGSFRSANDGLKALIDDEDVKALTAMTKSPSSPRLSTPIAARNNTNDDYNTFREDMRSDLSNSPRSNGTLHLSSQSFGIESFLGDDIDRLLATRTPYEMAKPYSAPEQPYPLPNPSPVRSKIRDSLTSSPAFAASTPQSTPIRDTAAKKTPSPIRISPRFNVSLTASPLLRRRMSITSSSSPLSSSLTFSELITLSREYSFNIMQSYHIQILYLILIILSLLLLRNYAINTFDRGVGANTEANRGQGAVCLSDCPCSCPASGIQATQDNIFATLVREIKHAIELDLYEMIELLTEDRMI
jgi:hypothetical protein